MKRFNRKFISVVMAVCTLLSGVLAADATSGMDHFVKVNDGKDCPFTDIDNAWFTENVKAVYEYGMMIGRSETEFAPEQPVTLAEVITIASRLNKMYQEGTTEFQIGKPTCPMPWYEIYVLNALDNDIIQNGEFSEFNLPASRAQTAGILGKALPAEVWEEILAISLDDIPDVNAEDAYQQEILKLYRSGVLTGMDSMRTFASERAVRRCEVAAIVDRIVCPGDRELGNSVSESDIILPADNSTQNLGSGSMRGFASVRALYDDAYDVVIADVMNADGAVSADIAGVDIALSEVKILQSYKGKLEAGQRICIEEAGIRKVDGDLAIDAVPLLGSRMRVLLFLTNPSNAIQKTVEGYGILGVYQGKYFLDGNDQVYAAAGFSDWAVGVPGCPDCQSLEAFNRLLS